MILHKELFDGEFVPLVYDLWYQYCKFFFASPVILDQDEALEKQIARQVGLVVSHNDCLSEMVFDRSPKMLGFGGVFKSTKSNFFHGVPTWAAEIPGGTEDRMINWSLVIPAVASLTILFNALSFYCRDNDINSGQYQQTIEYRMNCQPEPHGGGISVTIYPKVRQMVESNRERLHAEAQAAMLETSKKIWPGFFTEDTDFREREYRIWCHSHNEGLLLDACGGCLFAITHDPKLGWQLDSHNVDSPVQSLSLLAGIATINRLYREHEGQEKG